MTDLQLRPNLEADPADPKSIPVIGYAAADAKSPLQRIAFARRPLRELDVHIDVLYTGVCHSDVHQARDEWANTVWPCMPGHEIIGKVVAVGTGVKKYAVGDVVGVGCMVDSCGTCESCTAGMEQYCEKGFLSTYNGPFTPDGSNTYGGYSTAMVVTEKFVVRIPEKLDIATAAPLLCAGVTTYSPLKHWNIGKGHKIAIVGLGGLGHVAVQIAAKRGAEVTVITRRTDKKADALRFGAVDILLEDDKDAFKKNAGKFDYVLDTIPTTHDVNPILQLLKRDGVMTVVGALEPLEPPVNNQFLAFRRRSLTGSLIGSMAETQEILDFAAANDIRVSAEMIDMADINDAFDRMVDDKVEYRCVIDMKSLKN